MKTIKGRDVIYEIDEENKSVKVTVYNCKKEFKVRLKKQIAGQSWLSWAMFEKIFDDSIVKDTYSSKVTCKPGDVYNEDYGIELARTQALLLRDSAFYDAFIKIGVDINIMMEGIKKAITKNNDIGLCHSKDWNVLCVRKSSLREYKQMMNDEQHTLQTPDGPATPHYCAKCHQSEIVLKNAKDAKVRNALWKEQLLRVKDSDNDVENIVVGELCPKCSTEITNQPK